MADLAEARSHQIQSLRFQPEESCRLLSFLTVHVNSPFKVACSLDENFAAEIMEKKSWSGDLSASCVMALIAMLAHSGNQPATLGAEK